MEEDEDVNELWWRTGCWIWMGRFELGAELTRGEPFPARPHTENPNVSGYVFSVMGMEEK